MHSIGAPLVEGCCIRFEISSIDSYQWSWLSPDPFFKSEYLKGLYILVTSKKEGVKMLKSLMMQKGKNSSLVLTQGKYRLFPSQNCDKIMVVLNMEVIDSLS
jgi:hypothetical protein